MHKHNRILDFYNNHSQFVTLVTIRFFSLNVPFVVVSKDEQGDIKILLVDDNLMNLQVIKKLLNVRENYYKTVMYELVRACVCVCACACECA